MGVSINTSKALGVITGSSIIAPQTSSEFTNIYSTDYDGVDQYVGIGTGVLQFNRTTPFTISVWAYMRATEFSVIIGKSHNGGDFEGYQLHTLAASGAKNQIVFRIRKDSSQFIQIASTNTFNRNQWYHIAITYNGSGANGGLKLYVDGINQAGTRTGTLTQDLTWSPDRPFNIGSRVNGGNAFNGLINQPSIFTSELSAANIASIYNNDVPNDISSLSPTSWWRFDEGSGTVANDSGSAGNTGTLDNSLSYSTNVP